MRALAALVAIALIAGAGWIAYALLIDDDVGSTAEAILEEPERFAGKRVTVTGEVESFFPRAFTLGDSTWGDELLIFAPARVSIPRPIRRREARPRVRISGTVRINDDRLDLVPGADPFDGEPYVEATRIAVVPG